MMDRQHRLSKIEKLVSSALKEHKAKKKQALKELPFHARRHATAVAAIVLSGQPKINEPLNNAWKRALHHYGIDVNNPEGMDDQARAAQRLHPLIIGGEESSKFTEIFMTAPAWLLQFTGIAMDARLSQFPLPEISKKLRWGSDGYEDARRWPLLPSGIMTAGDPIPDIDPRQLWLALFCINTTPIPPDFLDTLSQEKDILCGNDPLYNDPVYKDISFALRLDGKPEEEWSRYEKRRMRKISERFSL
jgi:hypothetical protein